jgi:hypothetical protein
MTVTTQIVGTALAVGVAGAGAGLFILRAVIAKDIKPLGDAMLLLTGEMRSLTSSMADERTTRKEERDESRAIHRDLEKIVQDHDTRLKLHDQRIATLEDPPRPPVAIRKRRAS